MSLKFVFIICSLFLFACTSDSTNSDIFDIDESEVKILFNKEKWGTQQGFDYPYRSQMVEDVLYNDTIRDLSQDEILTLLGAPSKSTDGHLYYRISQKRLGAWPLSTRTLVFKFKEDQSVEWIKLHE
jgi:hypothetical protein